MGKEERMPLYSASVGNVVWLVTDRNNPSCGQMARVVSHDWRESGEVMVRYADGRQETFKDSEQKGKMFYAVRNEAGKVYDETMDGPLGLLRAFKDLDVGNIEEFHRRFRTTLGQDF